MVPCEGIVCRAFKIFLVRKPEDGRKPECKHCVMMRTARKWAEEQRLWNR